MALQGFGQGGNQLSSKYDTRLLSWGGYLNYKDQKADKENRWLLCVNTEEKQLHIVQHEQDQAVYKFDDIMCVFENLKYENALIIFWKNGKSPVQFFLDSQQDRDSLQQVLAAIPRKDVRNAAMSAGVISEHDCPCSKKGKMKWGKRHLIVCKSRLLLFRDKDKSVFPLQMMSLLEPNVTIQKSSQFPKAFQVNCQERSFHFQLESDNEVANFVDLLTRLKDKMQNEAKAYQKLKIVQETQSKRNMIQKSVMVRQQMQSQRMMSRRNLNEEKENALKVMLANGSVMRLDKAADDDTIYTTMSSQDLRKKKGLKFDKAFKPHKHQSSIFIWGKARPPRLYPQHTDQTTPFQHDQLSQKRFVYLSAAKDGHHVLGFTDNDWTFVWGEANFTGALGLGRETKSTLPFILKPLKKQKVIQVACSSRHGIAITMNSTVYGWGAKSLTNLPSDTSQPTPLNFLSNLGVTSISCSSTHSCAWHRDTTDVFTWGLPGGWLGIADSNTKHFGRVEFPNDVSKDKTLSITKVECANQYSLFLFSDGRVSACGVNEYGRMGVGKQLSECDKPTFIESLKNEQIGEISAGSFHSGFINLNGQSFTCGVGSDYRLGHGNEENVFEPKLIDSLAEVKLVRIECVEDRTFAITKYGCVLMWGVEPVSHMVHTAPFVYEYMRPYRIYQILGTKDFTVALGVHAKQPVPKPAIEVEDDVRMKKTYQALNSTIKDVINDGHAVSTQKGFKATDVYGGFVQVKKVEKLDNANNNNNNNNNNNMNNNFNQVPMNSQLNFNQMPPMNSQLNFNNGPPPGPPPNMGNNFAAGPPPGPPPNMNMNMNMNNNFGPPPNMFMNNNFNGGFMPPPNNNNGPPPGPPPNMNGNFNGFAPPMGPPPMIMQAQQFQMPPPPNNNNNGPPPGPPPNMNMNNNFGPPPNMNNNFGPPPPNNFAFQQRPPPPS